MEEKYADKLAFDTRALPNGIEVHSHEMDVPFFILYIQAPVGSAHSHIGNEGGAYGIAHFMEHALFQRSEKYPERGSFRKDIRLKGGSWNASTGPRYTQVYVSAPLLMQDEITEGLFEHVFKPVFKEEDLVIERTIVGNERLQKKYYPGTSELWKYVYTEWMNDEYYPKQQVFGSDTDLQSITSQTLSEFIGAYAVPGTRIIVGGGHDLERIINATSSIPTKPFELRENVIPAGWTRKEFHTKSFKDVDSPTYFIGNCIPEPLSTIDDYALDFILTLLTNSIHGPLHHWAREEKGWSYGVSYSEFEDTDRTIWYLKFPVNDASHIEEIRRELHARIIAALSDEILLTKEVARRSNREVFAFQTLDSRMNSALSDLKVKGRIVTQTEAREMLARCANTELLFGVYRKYMAPEQCGEFAALPISE